MSTITIQELRVEDWSECLRPTFEKLGLGDEPNVTKIEVVIGRSLGLGFFLWEEGTQRWWTCYYDEAAGDMHFDEPASREWKERCFEFWYGFVPNPLPAFCPCDQCRADDDPILWLESLTGATDWAEWEWESYEEIPVIY
jgi:hypothetical protein